MRPFCAQKRLAQSHVVLKSYRINGRTDTLTDSRVYSLSEYTKTDYFKHELNVLMQEMFNQN